MIAAGLYDGNIVLYNNLTAQEIASLQHIPKIDLNQKSAKTIYVYQEEISKDKRSSTQSHQYICYQNLADLNQGSEKKQEVVKIPMITKKETEGFKHSEYKTVGV